MGPDLRDGTWRRCRQCQANSAAGRRPSSASATLRSDVVEADPLAARCDEPSEVFPVSGDDLCGETGGEGHDDRVADVRRAGAAEEETGIVSAVLVEYGDVAASEETTELNLLW